MGRAHWQVTIYSAAQTAIVANSRHPAPVSAGKRPGSDSDHETHQDLAAFFLDGSLFWRRKLLHSRFSPPHGEEPMAANESKKCAHPVCTCQVTLEEYCSPQCEAMEKIPDVDCKCPHSICA